MRILIIPVRNKITQDYIFGGTEKVFLSHVNLFSQDNEVHIITSSDSEKINENHHYFDYDSKDLLKGRKMFDHVAEKIYQLDRKLGFDYIFLHDFNGTLCSSLLKFNLDFFKIHLFCHVLQNSSIISAKHMKHFDMIQQEGASIWYNSNFTRQQYMNWNRSDTELFMDFYGEIFPVFKAEKISPSPAKNLAISIQRLTRDREPWNLIRMMKKLPSRYDKIICTTTNYLLGDEEKYLKEMRDVAEVHVNTSWGFNQSLLRQAEYSISTKRDESFGLFVAESHNYGAIPLVLSRKKGTPVKEHSPQSLVFQSIKEAEQYLEDLPTGKNWREKRNQQSCELNSIEKWYEFKNKFI